MSAERRRLTLAFLFSLLIHTLLLSLTFGGQMLGLPGFAFPWRERRIEAPDLRVSLVPAQVTVAEPAGTSGSLVNDLLQQASIEKAVAGGPALTPSVFSSPPLGRTAEVIVLQSEAKATAQAEPAPDIATSAVPGKAPLRTEGSGDATPTPINAPVVIAVEQSAEATFAVPPPAPTPVIAVAPSTSIPEAVMPAPRNAGEVPQKPAEPEARERAVEVAKLDPPAREVQTQRQQQADQLEAARVEAAQLEAARQEAARVDAARLEAAGLETQRQEATRLASAQRVAQRQELARQEAARIESARLEAAGQETQRREATRLAAAQQEASRQELARLEASQREDQRKEGARLAAARLESDRQEAVRQAAAGKEAARIQEEKDEDARRAARREAMGRQLNEEAARRKATDAAATAARSPSTLPYSLSTARRFRLWGRFDPNAELVQYAETWARKIQFNTPVDTVREVAKRPHTNPMVTVAIRSDGSVESVTFVVSSGVAEVDETIRRIVQSGVPYQAFPPGMARDFDVIEVRRTWHFDTAIRLY